LVWRAVDTNSEKELAALKRAAELGAGYDHLVLSFADSVKIAAPPEEVYDFLCRADLWPQRLPHVARLDLSETDDGVQLIEMSTRSTDGSTHPTRSVRVCFPHSHIVYKQTATPEIMAAHVGRWTLSPTSSGVDATSHHTVVIRPEKVPDVLGPDGTVDRAGELVRHALGTNSLTTLRYAKRAAEGLNVHG
jgi:aromatase